MLLSIVVLSYNRPKQVARILKNISSASLGEFEVVIKDDRSPMVDEISQVVRDFQEHSALNVRFYENEKNLGYDLNLLSAFSIVNSEFVFLLSDDDYIDGALLPNLLNFLSEGSGDIYFTPYSNGGVVSRRPIHHGFEAKLSSIIYNSILFSGLVFRRSRVQKLNLNLEFLQNCIYSQVYLVCYIISLGGSCEYAPSDILHLGGDGENFFGKNQSAVNTHILSNREHITADLNYQTFLFNVIRKVQEDFGGQWLSQFEREYKKRLISYALRARGCGIGNYFKFLRSYYRSDIPFYLVPFFAMISLVIMPKQIACISYSWFRRKFRKSG